MELKILPFGERPPRQEGCPSSWGLFRFLAKELPEGEWATIQSHVSTCPHCTAVLASLEVERSAFQSTLPEASFLGQLEAHAQGGGIPPAQLSWPRRMLEWLGGGLRLPTLSAGLVVVMAMLVTRLPPGEQVLLRGGPQLDALVLRVGADKPEVFQSGDSAREGDRLQFTLHPAGFAYGLVVNLDDKGTLSLYHGDKDGFSLSLPHDHVVLLPTSIELDNFEGQERVYFLLSDEPLRFLDVEADLLDQLDGAPLDIEALEHLPISGVKAQASLRVVKP